MRVLMLGWEFPPFIAGGLGVACYGLTKALDKQGHHVIFVLPKPVDRRHASHVRLLSPDVLRARAGVAAMSGAGSAMGEMAPEEMVDDEGQPLKGFQHAVFRGVPASFSSPYPGGGPAGFVSLSGAGAGAA